MTNEQLADALGQCELHVPEGRFFHGKVLVSTELLALAIAALRAPCLYIRTAKEGTSYCALAESATCPPGKEVEWLAEAARNMDWEQVILNGGPPCFHLQAGDRFCGRAERWDGHDDIHKFVSLADLLAANEAGKK